MPEYNTYPLPSSDKLSELEKTKTRKLEDLSGYKFETVDIESVYDADSIRFSGVTGGLGKGKDSEGNVYDRTDTLSIDRLGGIDAYEMFPKTEETFKYQNEDPNGIERMRKQRYRLAEELGRPYEEVTNEDVYQRAARDTLKVIAELEAGASGRGQEYLDQLAAWEPSEELTAQWRTSPFTLGDKENIEGRGYKAERAFLDEYGFYGRPLSLVKPVGSDKLLGEATLGYEYFANEELPPVTASEGDLQEYMLRREAEDMGFFGRMGNAVKAAGRTFTKEAGVDLADWIGESLNSATGGFAGWDVGTEEEKTKLVNDLFGFNPYAAEDAYKQAEIHARNIVEAAKDEKKDVDFGDVYELIKIGFTTPEMLGDSVGFIGSFFVPFLGLASKGSKLGIANKAIKATEKELKAGAITKEAAKAKVKGIKAEMSTLDKVQKFAQNNAGLMQVSAGNVNDQIDAYKEEHGEGPSVAKVAQMFATETLMLSLDRWADLSILKAPNAFKGVKEAFSAATKEGKAKLVGKAVITATGIIANMGKEAGQEYLQEVGQAFNVKFNFDDNDTFVSAIDEAGELLVSDEMLITGVMGAGLGAGGALQFSAVGGALPATKAVLSLKNSFPKNPVATPSTTRVSGTGQEPVTEDEIVIAKKAYGELLKRVNNDIASKGVTADNIGMYLDDLEELNSTMHVISTSSPEKVENGMRAYNAVVDQLESFVKNNPDAVLTKRVTRKSLSESIKQKEEQEKLNSYSEDSKKAVQALASAIGSGETKDFEPSYRSVVSSVKNVSYEDFTKDTNGALNSFIQDVEKSLTGNTSESVKESYDNIKKTLAPTQEAKPIPPSSANSQTIKGTSKQAKVDFVLEDEASTATKTSGKRVEFTLEDTLGSSPSGSSVQLDTESRGVDDTTLESDYDDDTRALDAERIAIALLGSGRTYDEEFTGKLYNFARKNGVSEERLNAVVKSYAAVEDEATVGVRGYVSRIARIKRIMESSNPDKKEFTKEVRTLSNFVAKLSSSSEELSRGIAQASKEADRLNKLKGMEVSGKSLKVPTEYKKFDGKFLDIVVKKGPDGKWFADTIEAQQRLDLKQGYVTDIRNELNAMAPKAERKLPGMFPSAGIYKVPLVSGKGSDVRKSDASYIENIGKSLGKVGVSNAVTRVIVGDKSSKKWGAGSDYRKANSLIVNSGNYSAQDVVLINSLGVIEKKGKKEGTTVKLPDLFSSKDADEASLTPAQKEFKAAIAAGSTIVLDKDMMSTEGKASKAAIASYLVGNHKYEALEGYNSTIFVKPTEKIVGLIATHKEELKKEAADKTAKAKSKQRLVSVSRALANDLSLTTGSELTQEERTALDEEYVSLYADVAEKQFKGDVEKLEAFLNREKAGQVSKKVKELLTSKDPEPLDNTDPAFNTLVQRGIDKASVIEEETQQTLKKWKEITEKGLTSRQQEKAVTELLSTIEVAPRSFVRELLSAVKSISTGKKDIFELEFFDTARNKVLIKTKREEPTEEEIAKLIAANEKGGTIMNKRAHMFRGVRRVHQDVSKMVNVSNTTVVNSVPFEALPLGLRESVEALTKLVPKALKPLEAAEYAAQTDDKGDDGYYQKGNFNLYNSPARGLIFDKEGKPNVEVITAMYIGIGELLKSDMRSLMRGHKTNAELAKMFNVQEFEVTKDMRDFAKNYGAFLKTVANSVGKTVASNLGITKNATSKGEYEALIADLGNSTLSLAEAYGLLEIRPVSTNELAELLKDGEVRKDEDSVVHLVNVKDAAINKKGFEYKEPAKVVKKAVENYEIVKEQVPVVSSARTRPSFVKPNKEHVEKATSQIRNDILDLDVPEEGKKFIEMQMTTPFELDLGVTNTFLDAVVAEDSKIKELLGFVSLDSEKFNSMSYEEKENQVGKNRDVEDSIEYLREAKKMIDESGKTSHSLYFDMYYTGNNRYMIDSTLDPMGDKLHRFLVAPRIQKMWYKTSKNSKGGILFEATSSSGTSDQSYTVRLALYQAFGKSFDKVDSGSVIEFADAVLSMSKAQIKKAKESILEKGSYELSTASDITFELEAEHLSHALQAIDFLEKLKDAESKGESFASSLSLEFDSLTSGFANKLQQMPILKNMAAHYARTGVLTPEYQQELKNAINFKGDGESFSPAKGHTIADILHTGSKIGFFDSYQNLAKTTVEKLSEGVVIAANLTAPLVKGKGKSGLGVFTAIKPLLPGGALLDKKQVVEKVDGAIRSLFKNPFMIFNYSASINRITTDLGYDVVKDIVSAISKADFSKSTEDTETVKGVAAGLLSQLIISHPDTKKPISTPLQLQEVFRNYPLSSIAVKGPQISTAAVGKGAINKPGKLDKYLSEVVKLTYGEVVKEVFESEFKPFIEVQNAMNDTFKVAFRVFDKKRMDMLNKMRLTKKDRMLTAKDHADVLKALWNDFPWIVGPLTGTKNKDSAHKAVIAVATSSARSPRPSEEARVKPQTHLASGSTRTITPLVKYLEEAVSAGSVLPFHAIDGAEMARALLDVNMKGFLAIHDAFIGPIDQSDNAGFSYQKNMKNINETYVLADALKGLVERLRPTIDNESFGKEFGKLSAKGLKIAKKEDTFPQAAVNVIENMEKQIKIIEEARELYYGENGVLKDAWYGNLIGTPGGMYMDGMEGPDLSYKEVFKDRYRAVSLLNNEKDKAGKDAIIEAILKSSVPTALKNNIVKMVKVDDALYNVDTVSEFLDSKAAATKKDELKVALDTIKGDIALLDTADAINEDYIDPVLEALEGAMSELEISESLKTIDEKEC